MPMIEVSEQEAQQLQKMRMSVEERRADLAKKHQEFMANALARMTPEQRKDYEAEQARLAALTPEERRAEQLLAIKKRVEDELATIKVDRSIKKPKGK